MSIPVAAMSTIFTETELFRILFMLGCGLGLAVLMFVFAARMMKSAQNRAADALGQLDVSKLERPSKQIAEGRQALRFAHRGQRALLDFAAPRTSPQAAVAPRDFGGLDDLNMGVTRIRYWLVPPSSFSIKSELASPTTEGPWSPQALALLEKLRRTRLEGVGVCLNREGLFLIKAGWLTGADLQCFVDVSAELVSMFLEGTLLEAP